MKNLKIVYAEDDKETIEDTLYLLKKSFSEIYTAVDGVEALELYEKHRPDILLLDINMPKLTGLEVLNKIRESDEYTPIVMITAHSDTDKLINAINDGVSAYILKPFNISEVTKTIINIIDTKPKMQEVNLVSDFIWDKQNFKLLFKGEVISLTKNETSLMKYLSEHLNQFHTPQELGSVLRSDSDVVKDANSIIQLISRFKKKIAKELNTEHFFIENVYGLGYKIKQV